ncbi:MULTISPECIES: GMC family oxidoreductase [Actinosynnema]|uniref:GMC oxidoreductase n=1 Tax=Actinosynnema TaxID=40566 RepID=UPI0020A30AAD|nr:GMC family oxidoreductase [Actinosynnema pretiosum]MCP2098243.1 cholesterol oxidase [Actinosynnema pretiosum]
MPDPAHDYDVLVIGSGFGGAVSALRLTEKGYRVGVLEAGRRFADHEFARTSWRLRDYLFAPALGCYGIQRIDLLRDVLVLSGAGVGGGSLVYANTLYRPGEHFFTAPAWSGTADWKSELERWYDQAERMLGVVENPLTTPADRVLRAVADDLGVGSTYHRSRVGVFFAERPGQRVADPFFGGVGPERAGCTHCGECMTGCRHNAKNTLPKNYLHLAERAGATVHPLTTVTDVRPVAGGYEVRAHRTGRPWRTEVLTAGQVVFSAAAMGTQRLLHSLRDRGVLPRISARLGVLSRTNAEAVLAVKARTDDVDYSRGVAITSSVHPDARTHVEPVRYGRGSNVMGLLMTVLADPEPGRARWRSGVDRLVAQRRDLPRLLNPRRWSERSVALLFMQNTDTSLTTRGRRGPFGRGLTSGPGEGEQNEVWNPVGHELTRRVAEKIGGIPGGAWTDFFDVPLTGHFIGGCGIGASAESGVVDAYHRVFGHEGLHVVDGSTIPANLGVNPSLTITAMAERAMSLWPNKGEPDPRPPLGEVYRRVRPVTPRHPVVPPTAPAALLPITPV